jgi:hypothetical protein
MYLGIRIYSRTVRTAHRIAPARGFLRFAISCSQSNHISLHMDVKERTFACVLCGMNCFQRKMVGLIGLEPMTPALSRRCSNQLSYRPSGLLMVESRWLMVEEFLSINYQLFTINFRVVEVNGFEPLTFCLQSRRSTN